MDRGSSEEGVDDFLRLISCALIVSYLGLAIFLSVLVSTFTLVALIHSYLLSSELLNFGEFPSDGSRETPRLTDRSAVRGFRGMQNLGTRTKRGGPRRSDGTGHRRLDLRAAFFATYPVLITAPRYD